PLMRRHINDAKNAQKEVTNEVLKTVEAYNSVAEAAKRQSDATKDHYEHQKKMLEVHKETELARARTPGARVAVEKKYAAAELQLQKDQQNEEIHNKTQEAFSLDMESKTKLNQAN